MTPLSVYLPFNVDCLRGDFTPAKRGGGPPAGRGRWLVVQDQKLLVAPEGEGFRLVWDAVPAVAEWEVRISERADVRSDYVERETLLLAAGETSVELPLADTTLRVNILGRGRGRLQRRALISGLTKEGWRDRWQRRASAS